MEKRKSRYAVIDLWKIEEKSPNLLQLLEDHRNIWEKDVFVLRPETDQAARAALETYAKETKNMFIREKAKKWLKGIDHLTRKKEKEDIACSNGNRASVTGGYFK